MDIENERLLRRAEVLRLIGLSKSTLHRMVGRGAFPAQVQTGERSVAWRLRDVREWIRSRQ